MTSVKPPGTYTIVSGSTGLVYTEGTTSITPDALRYATSSNESAPYRCDCDVCKVPTGPTDDGPSLAEHATIIGKAVLGLGCGRVGCGLNLTSRETAIILCALRKMQDESPKICPDHSDDGEESFVEHDEFDDLCEKINFGGDEE